jgi:hypothetical protein
MTDSNQPKKPLPTWLVVIAGLIGFAVISPIVRHVVSDGVGAVSGTDSTATPADARALFEKQWASEPLFVALQENFPDDYERIINAISAAVANRELSMTEVGVTSFAAMRDFSHSKLPAISHASPGHLKALINAEFHAVAFLAARDVGLCAKFAVKGLDSAKGLPDGFAAIASQSGKAMVEAARSGTDSPTTYAALSERDFANLEASMHADPDGKRWSELVLSGDIVKATETDQCSASVAFYRALATMPVEQSAPWVSFIMQEKAKSLIAK